jgi:hypothetical protein
MTTEQQQANARIRERIEEARELDEEIREAWSDLRVLLDRHKRIIDRIETELGWFEPVEVAEKSAGGSGRPIVPPGQVVRLDSEPDGEDGHRLRGDVDRVQELGDALPAHVLAGAFGDDP